MKFSGKARGGGFTVLYNFDSSRVGQMKGRTQYLLDSQIMADMEPFMPLNTEKEFIDKTITQSVAWAGTGYVCAGVGPYGRFLYEGKVMVSSITGSPWARKGIRKVLVSQFAGHTNARENIDYCKTFNPEATDHWFEKAKDRYFKDWLNIVKKGFK